ncbi:ACT domain-containing protein [Clostridium sp. DJ247]|uniref:ACT domain-containing protein n=1 Tax=Clostridium sp. DJ247 TaxID=2726188 RepID=UPI001626348E|nr:ACT domain-containing protein [Clostridium sp. DJ247]MBC2582461.1 ACT domain-containing protein [Clostridium sp. DJ247]
MKAIITVVGKDKPGIIAGVSADLLKLNINILDVNQTIMEGFFTMIMLLELANANVPFDKVKEALLQTSKELEVDIKIQREEIFNSMHTL